MLQVIMSYLVVLEHPDEVGGELLLAQFLLCGAGVRSGGRKEKNAGNEVLRLRKSISFAHLKNCTKRDNN